VGKTFYLKENEKLKTESGAKNNSQLPKGWEVKKLGEVCDIQLGKTPHRKTESLWDKGKETSNIWLSIADMQHGKILYDSKEYISNLGIKNIKYVPKGTLMLSFKLTLGRVSFAGKNLFTNEAIASLVKLSTKIDKNFLFYYFSFFDWNKETEGDFKVKGRTLNKERLKALNIILPPLSEQKRIIAILDRTFKAIDQAKTNAEQNFKNAKELFESYLNRIFEEKGDDWEENTLNEVCIVKRGSSPRPIKKYITENEDGINWIKIGDTKNVNKFIYRTAQKITKEGAEKSRYVKKGDFILSNSMSFGKPYIMKSNGCIHDGWFKLEVHNFIDVEYFYQLLCSPYVNKQFQNLASGSVVKNISGDLVKKVSLPIPSLETQKQIVAQLDNLQTQTKKLEIIYQQKINNLIELKKSILQKAFEGAL
jgi:type I restriction enzyme S subunit